MSDDHLEDRRMLDGLRTELDALDDLLMASELRQAAGGFARSLRLRTHRKIAEVSRDLGVPMGTIAGIEAGNAWTPRGYLAWLAVQVHDLDSTLERLQNLRGPLLDLLNELMQLLGDLRTQIKARGESPIPLRRIDWKSFACEEDKGWEEIRAAAATYPPRPWPSPQFPPRPRSMFLGREDEIDKLADWLCERNFLSVVVCGPTGIGKTRLIQELVYDRALKLRNRFKDGASYIDLALIRNQLAALESQPQDQELLTLSAIARQLGITEMQGQSLLTILGAHLQHRRLLLVIDNVEYSQTIVTFVKTLEQAQGLRIIIVARGWDERMLLPRQKVLSIGPLALDDAVDLFEQRAGDPMPLPEDSATRQMIKDICRCLQRHPLLIKLIAASHKIYSLHEIHAQIHALLPAPTAGKDQEAPLPEVVRLAVHHFESTHQELLAYLSIFPASFTINAAQAVCQGDEARVGVRRLLADLTEYHLARGLITEGGRRYTLQDAFREHLVRYSPDGFETARQRFVQHFLSEAERAARYLTLPAKSSAFTRGIACFAQEYPNMRAALGMALTSGDDTRAIQFGAALWRYWWSTGSQSEGRLWLDQLRHRAWPYPRAAWSQTLTGLAAIEHALGKLSEAHDLGRQASQWADGADDVAAQAAAHIIFGAILIDYADPITKERQIKPGIGELEKGMEQARLVGDAWLEALCTYNLGRGWHEKARLLDEAYGPDREPDLERARKDLVESLKLSEMLGDTWLIATIFCWLGRVAAAQGQFAEARRHWQESRRLFESIPHTLGVAQVLYGLADVAYQEQDYGLADKITSERLRIETNLRNQQGIASCRAWQGLIKAAQGDSEGGRALLRQSLNSYLALKDLAGEAEVTAWMRDLGL